VCAHMCVFVYVCVCKLIKLGGDAIEIFFIYFIAELSFTLLSIQIRLRSFESLPKVPKNALYDALDSFP